MMVSLTSQTKNTFSCAKSITDKDGFFPNKIPQGSYELELLNDENIRIIIEKGHFTEVDYPFTTKPNPSTLRSIMLFSRQEPLISFLSDDSMRNLLGINASTKYEEYNLSPNPAEILPFDNFFKHTDIARGMIFKGKDLEW